jgi:hypothetical protein
MAVLTWISIYWFSRGGPTASLRIYYEVDINSAYSVSETPPTIPLGLSHFPMDILVFPKRYGEIFAGTKLRLILLDFIAGRAAWAT